MPRKCSMYSSSDEETYDSSQQHYSLSHLHRKTCSPSSSRHRKELQSIVHHTLVQTRETIEADHTLKQGAKGMKASHSHVQKNGRGRSRDHIPMIQGIFTHTKSKSITDHDHIQLI